ncbi:hypothetical protein [Natranaeroarchaeum sulfidigenes]|uniref:AI-2E family transporter n=1 Tax=Natranaeroarchaeum sulfidigenes TaxID=2784880 RepID=A0A897ML84_9EURY|nr:hypothetical protein [Natranaeroarchaeum sulfidigenes]QSG01347.1 hypothetical protein AArcS_0107 [Natranaeroarchaeum sulfidigenes]
MSVLGRFVDWFGDQTIGVQVGATTLLFAVLFVMGLYTLGLLPAVIVVAVLIEHWYRSDTSFQDWTE